MSTVVHHWSCSCGHCLSRVPLAHLVVLENGYIERKCRSCDTISVIGKRDDSERVKLRCATSKTHHHVLAFASENWRGKVVIYCDRCKELTTITHASTQP